MNRCGAILCRAVLLLAGFALFAVPVRAQVVHPTDRRLREKRTPQDSASLILDYARRIQFDTAEGAGDRQRLIVGECVATDSHCRLGPLAKIEPRRRYHDPNWDAPPRDTGEVIARIISNAPYRRIQGNDTTYKFNLRSADTVYWWVGPSEGRGLVSVFISSNRAARPFVSDLTLDPHEPGHWRQGLARWIWEPQDEAAWGTCDGRRCCKSSGIALPAQR